MAAKTKPLLVVFDPKKATDEDLKVAERLKKAAQKQRTFSQFVTTTFSRP